MLPLIKRLYDLLLLTVLLSMTVSFGVSSATPQGGIDLSDWDSSRLPLDRSWEVIRGKLVPPSEFDMFSSGETVDFPDRWHTQKNPIAIENGWPSGFGAASYRLRLKLPVNDQQLSLIVQTPYTASEVWINGQLLASNGKISETSKGAKAFYFERHIALPNERNIEIVMLISNFEHNAGGILRPPILGLTRQIDRETRTYDLSYLFIFGALSALLIFHLAYFFKSHPSGRDWSHFWYCVLVGVVIVRLATLNTILFKVFPNFPQFSDKFLVYLTLYSSSAVYMAFLASIFPKEFPPIVRKSVFFGSIPFIGSVLLLPVHSYTQLQDYFIIFALVVLIYNQGAIIQAWRKRRHGAGAIVLFTGFFFVTVLNDALHYLHAYNLRPFSFFDLMPFGFLLLSIGHAIALSARSRAIYEQSVILADDLLELNKTLDEKVLRRTQEAVDAKLIAENSVAEKNNFISAASHDLRQPVHALSIFNETLMIAAGSNQKLVNLADKQTAIIGSLSEMLETMLEASMLEAKTLPVNMASVSLAALFRNLQDALQPVAAESGVELRIVSASGFIWADEKHMRRVISNLVTNAIKASKTKQGKIVVGVRRKGAQVELIIADNGCGISGCDQKQVFNRYTQVGAISDIKEKGLGLGLSIVKELCALMNINISLSSVPEKGTVFKLDVVSAVAQDGGIEADVINSIPAASAKRLVVLVIDDNHAAKDALTDLFRGWGYAARGVASKAEALTTLEDLGKPDLVVTDYRLDEHTTGVATITAIEERCGEVPAIIVTGSTSVADLQALAVSQYKVFHKPLDQALLKAYLMKEIH